MSKIILRRRWSGLMAAGFAALVPTVFGVGAPASAAPATNVIVLPGATSAEGIAVGDGATFYAGDLFTGDIYRGDLQRGTAGLLTDAPAGRMAAGMKLDRRSGLLYVAGAFTGQAYVYDAATGASTTIDGVSVPNVDGIVFDAGRLWAVQNFDNEITRWRLSPDLGSGVPDGVITSELFQIPTTAALYGNELAVVNAKFDTGLPPTADQYEVVIVER